MTLEFSQLGELSTAGLLADKVLLQLDNLKENKFNVDRNIFEFAATYLSSAIDGLNDIDKLTVSGNTAYALSAFGTISRAVSSRNIQESTLVRMQELLTSIKLLCDSLALGQTINEDQKERLDDFFSHISQYTSEQHQALLFSPSKQRLFK